MKKLLISVLAFVPMLAIAQGAYQPPAALCTTEISYLIKDADGNVRDSTVYKRSWPIDCVTSTRLKYEVLGESLRGGEKQFKQLLGETAE